MKYIVAVSGGVDSVVLLDMLAKEHGPDQLVVAHFDHGIRPESDADARFVRALAGQYDLPFETRREELGANASEALARERRYAFLWDVAKKHDATIVTAHHQDDLIETIAINLVRGTGWRGLAVFANSTVKRPLVDKTKSELYTYALSHNLEWVEDETNGHDVYLRNRLRRTLASGLSNDARDKLLHLWNQQVNIRTSIEQELEGIPESVCELRYFFIMLPETVAAEILGYRTKGVLTRPQIVRLLLAIKTASPHTVCEPGGGLRVEFGVKDFAVVSL